MTFATFGQLDDPTPTLPEVQGMIADNARLLMPTVAATIDPIGPALQENAATLGKVTGRIGRVANGALKAQRELLGIPIDALNASLASQLAENQARVNQLQALGSMSPQVQPMGPSLPSQPSVQVLYEPWYRCSDGARYALASVDNVKRAELASTGYLQYPGRTFQDPYSPLAFWDSDVGKAWILVHCFPQSTPPVGPPPPPNGPPPPPPDPTSSKWRLAYYCLQGGAVWTPIQPGQGPPLDPTYGQSIELPGYTFDSGEELMAWTANKTPEAFGAKCSGTPVIGTPPPPGCCAPWDLMPYIDKLCKCIKEACTADPVDTDQPLAYFLGEGTDEWHKNVSEFLGFDGAEIFEAGSLEEMKEIWNRIVNG